MSNSPTRLMRQEAARLFGDETTEAERFLGALLDPPEFAPCILWTGSAEDREGFEQRNPAQLPFDWQPPFVLRLESGAEPGRDPLHDTGSLYSLDFSSTWAASPLLALPANSARTVLDLCAAPGGKSVFASLALDPTFLLSNEVIGKRLAILRHNLARCKISSAYTQRLDPRDLADQAPGAFDAVIVDAPCSGQSLLAKGTSHPGAFHPSSIRGNAKRQTGILTAAAECLAPGGWMLYSTCTFSERENERVVSRVLERRPDLCPRPVAHLAPWQSSLANFPAYRLYPQDGLGAGAFTCLLRRDLSGTKPKTKLPTELTAYPVRSATQ